MALHRSILDARPVARDGGAAAGSVMEEITPRLDHRANFRSVLDERVAGVDHLAGPLSDAGSLRPPLEPADVPAATLLLVLLGLAVTRAGLVDVVVENLLVFGRLGVGGVDWVSGQLPDATVLAWAKCCMAVLVYFKGRLVVK